MKISGRERADPLRSAFESHKQSAQRDMRRQAYAQAGGACAARGKTGRRPG